jgi:5-formyltetrahydrofolate cyclo-ligase
MNSANGIPDDPASLNQRKIDLRRLMIARRESLAETDCRLAAEGFRRSLPSLLAALGWPDSGPNLCIAAYAAMRREADLLPACSELLARPAELYFPAVQGRGSAARLVFGKVPPQVPIGQFLQPGCFGVAEPPADSWLPAPPLLDIVLLPGLAFDKAGHRLGWGRAFYDRLIPALPGCPVLVGVCYDFQIIDGGIPSAAHDRTVDWLLTPGGYQPAIRTV